MGRRRDPRDPRGGRALQPLLEDAPARPPAPPPAPARPPPAPPLALMAGPAESDAEPLASTAPPLTAGSALALTTGGSAVGAGEADALALLIAPGAAAVGPGLLSPKKRPQHQPDRSARK